MTRKTPIILAAILALALHLAGPAQAGAPVFVALSLAPANVFDSRADTAAREGLTQAFLAGRSFNVLSPTVLKSTTKEIRRMTNQGMDPQTLSKITAKHGVDLLMLYTPDVSLARGDGKENLATVRLTARVVNGETGAIVQEKTGKATFRISASITDPANCEIVDSAMRQMGQAVGKAIAHTDEVVNLFLTFGR